MLKKLSKIAVPGYARAYELCALPISLNESDEVMNSLVQVPVYPLLFVVCFCCSFFALFSLRSNRVLLFALLFAVAVAVGVGCPCVFLCVFFIFCVGLIQRLFFVLFVRADRAFSVQHAQMRFSADSPHSHRCGLRILGGPRRARLELTEARESIRFRFALISDFSVFH